VISINGDHPAHIHVGDTDADLGATITGPKADLNLGISTYVNGAPMNPIQLDTTQAPAAHGSPLTLLSGRPAAAVCDGIERLNSRHAV
jgi:uncharacterized Zn-binding protein involved in type VI secretion